MTLKRSCVTKKWLVIPVTLVLVLFLLVGCTVSSKGDLKVNSSASEVTEPSSSNDASAATRMEKLKIAMSVLPTVENYDTNYFTKMIEKDMNIDLEFMLLPSNKSDARTKFSLMVSSGSELPDVLNMPLGKMVALDYASKGIFVKLNDYYADPVLAKNFLNMPKDDREYVYQNLRLADGNVYSLFSFTPFEWNEARNRFWINKEWLQKVNMEIPTTTDEFYEVLKEFTENDLNENGKKDEIGVVGAKEGWGIRPFDFLMNAFLYADANKSFFSVENGKIIASFVQPEWKEGLEYLNQLCKGNLLSPLSFTQDFTQLKALVNVEGGMAGVVASGSFSVFGPEVSNDMTLMGPLTGPKGVSYTPYTPSLPNDFWYITKDCKNPEQAFSIGDYMLSEICFKTNRFGEKGVDWTDDPEVCSEWMGSFEELLGIKAKLVQLNNIWSKPQNKHWNGEAPKYQSRDTARQEATIKKSEAATTPNFTAQHFKEYVPKFPKEVISNFPYTKEEIEQIANIKTTIDAYVYDMAVAFITGNKPLSDWDNYLKELDKMGLEEYLSVSQKAYERTVK
jgi:putative aldouronate transport system substrate-binding protein